MNDDVFADLKPLATKKRSTNRGVPFPGYTPNCNELLHFPASVRKNAGRLIRECFAESRLAHYRQTVSREFLESCGYRGYREYAKAQALTAFCDDHNISVENARPIINQAYREYLESTAPTAVAPI